MTKYYTSGEFAEKAHASIRTIRYYDQKNLLKPAARTKSGARRYTDQDFAKLQQILLLKYLGFSLNEIREMTIGAGDAQFLLGSLQIQKRLAEDDDKVVAVRKVNVGGTQNIANVAKKLDVPMVYLSTDYVFDGQGKTPWKPDFKGYKPMNVYGETKLGGEEAVANTLDKYFIVRIAWVFGVNSHNFIKTMLKVGANHDEVRVVDDQIGTPTYTFDLARLLVDMIETDKYGYYHATNSELPETDSGFDENGTKTGYISWYDFTKEIYRQAGYDTKVTPVTTEEYGLSKAVRPFNSRLDKSKLVDNGFMPLPTWPDAVKRYLEILKKQGFFDNLK